MMIIPEIKLAPAVIPSVVIKIELAIVARYTIRVDGEVCGPELALEGLFRGTVVLFFGVLGGLFFRPEGPGVLLGGRERQSGGEVLRGGRVVRFGVDVVLVFIFGGLDVLLGFGGFSFAHDEPGDDSIQY